MRGELEAIVELVALPPTPRACPFFRCCGDNKVVNEEAIEPNMRDGDKRHPGDNVTDDGVDIVKRMLTPGILYWRHNSWKLDGGADAD